MTDFSPLQVTYIVEIFSDYLQKLMAFYVNYTKKRNFKWEMIEQRNQIVQDGVRQLTSLLTSLNPSITVTWPLPTANEDIAVFVKNELVEQGYYVTSSEVGKLTISLIRPTHFTKPENKESVTWKDLGESNW